MDDHLPDMSPYQIRALIQRGDIGSVYRAYDPRYKREVALKGLWGESSLSDEERFRFFKHEADILRRLDHPRIPRLYEYVEDERPYLAIQYVKGDDLLAKMGSRRRPLPVEKVIRWGMQVCDILHYLHTLKPEAIAYRDLKPSHIVIDRRGQAWLVDFNLALVLPPGGIATDASEEGTAGYAAPEQYGGTVSPQSDIYGLGATLHYLLTGRNPRLEAPFTFHQAPPRRVNPGVTAGLERTLLRALKDDPNQRFKTARAFGKALERELDRLND